MSEIPRRRVLRRLGGLGVIGVAGCATRGRDETTTTSPAPSRSDGRGSSTPTSQTLTTEQPSSTDADETPEVTGTWPMHQYDARNLGHAPAATGPKAGVHQRWVYETDPLVRSSPAVVDGSVYIGAGSRLHALALEDGEARWHVEADGPVDASPAVVDGTAGGGPGSGLPIDTGLCVAGPCTGKSLRRVDAEVEDGIVFVTGPVSLRQGQK